MGKREHGCALAGLLWLTLVLAPVRAVSALAILIGDLDTGYDHGSVAISGLFAAIVFWGALDVLRWRARGISILVGADVVGAIMGPFVQREGLFVVVAFLAPLIHASLIYGLTRPIRRLFDDRSEDEPVDSEAWTCESCGIHNTPEAVRCECGHTRTRAEPATPMRPKRAARNKPAGIAGVVRHAGKWACGCGASNRGDARFCKACGKPRPSTKRKCKHCSRIGDRDARYCDGCGRELRRLD